MFRGSEPPCWTKAPTGLEEPRGKFWERLPGSFLEVSRMACRHEFRHRLFFASRKHTFLHSSLPSIFMWLFQTERGSFGGFFLPLLMRF